MKHNLNFHKHFFFFYNSGLLPTPPQYVKAAASNSTEIIMKWKHPSSNCNSSCYYVTYIWEDSSKTLMKKDVSMCHRALCAIYPIIRRMCHLSKCALCAICPNGAVCAFCHILYVPLSQLGFMCYCHNWAVCSIVPVGPFLAQMFRRKSRAIVIT